MRTTWKMMAVAGVLGIGALAFGVASAHAGCCGGGSQVSRAGGYGGGHTFARSYASYGGGSCCNMAGMNMGGMQMPSVQTNGASMASMNMGGYATPAPAPASAA